MPCKQINLDSGPYLQRYFMFDHGGADYWIHRYLSADSERHVHNHPFYSRSIVLLGGITEEVATGGEIERLYRGGVNLTFNDLESPNIEDCLFNLFEAGIKSHDINPDTWHRIDKVEPETWTLLKVHHSRQEHWYFIDEKGMPNTMQSSPRNWWKQFKPRGQNEGDIE